jgi:glycosyltransferase involved in cell wall biosynthesis
LPATVVLSGKMSYHANVTAAIHLVREIMPFVWAQRPDVQVWLVGKDPAREVRALAQAGDSTTGQVLVTGTVTTLRDYLGRATIAAAPVPYGAGIQNKVLEAMACGAPVIASEQAASALQARAQRDLLVAGSAQEFVQSILTLLDSPTHRAAIGAAGRRYVERHHAWSASAARLEQIYGSVLHTVTATGSVTRYAVAH